MTALEVHNLSVWFQARSNRLSRSRGIIRAVDSVSFDIREGELFSLVGESGSGKSTVARAIMQLNSIRSGSIRLFGQDLETTRDKARLRRQVQMIFQDPNSSLDPHMTVADILAEPMLVNQVCARAELPQQITRLLEMVGLNPDLRTRNPHQLSGGQRQRVAIARALSLSPKLIIADEPVSALDVSIQAQILNLIQDLQHYEKMTMLLISHDLAVVRHLSDRVGVMYLGRIVELSDSESLFSDPRHEYTKLLLQSCMDLDVERPHTFTVPQGELPSPITPPPGCVFHTRCPKACQRCRTQVPELRPVAPGHWSACHFA